MDLVRADAIAARAHLAAHGWIARNSESFRHLPPPDAPLWLGGGDAGTPASDAGSAWTLKSTGANVQARWLDASDHAQRIELLEGLPRTEDAEAAPFAWAHRALLGDGLRVRVPAAVSGGSTLLRIGRLPADGVEAPLLAIELQAGAHCTLVETHEAGEATQNLQVHIRLAPGAQLRHVRLVTPSAGAYLAHHVQVRLDDTARYEQFLLATGSSYHLQRTLLGLEAPSATARASGVLLAAGTALEQQVRSRHDAAATQSHVEMLALGSGAARIVGNAHTYIAPGARGADVRQRLAGIPTAGQPKLVLRPHLEIHHDDVQAAHGATWGALPEEALFLARQRGLDEASAKALIVEGLARAVLAGGLDESGEADLTGLDAALGAAVSRHLAAEAAKGIPHG